MRPNITAQQVKLGPNHDSGFYLWPEGHEPILCQWEPMPPKSSPRGWHGRIIVQFSRTYSKIVPHMDAARVAVARHLNGEG